MAWNTPAYGELKPWLIPAHAKFFSEPTHVYTLAVPEKTETGMALTDLFNIRIKPIARIPEKKIFNTKQKEELTQKDFQFIVNYIERSLHLEESHSDNFK